jgi:predicted flap endonuclease-1-like 5' DNA nuclease
MLQQVLPIIWTCLLVAMLAGAALVGLAWWLWGRQPTIVPEETAILETKLKAAREECENCARTRKEQEARIGDLEKVLVSSKSRTAELENRMRVMEAEKAGAVVAAATSAVALSQTQAQTQSSAPDPTAATWASLADSMENDNLEEIHGIGPKLATLLHGLGVHTFKQIALWSEADIDQVDAKLEEFKGRIRREGWVESAKACHWRKYREALGGYTPPPES